MNADKNFVFNPCLSVFIGGHNSFTRSDGAPSGPGSESASEPGPEGTPSESGTPAANRLAAAETRFRL